MTCKLQSTLEDSGIEWPALRNHIPCMAHVIQLALGAFMSSLGVKCLNRSWEAHERDPQFGQNASIDNWKSQRLRKEGNARINKVLAMRPSLVKIMEKVPTSTYSVSPETDLHKAENACCIDYANTWSSKRVHWNSKSQSPHLSTTQYGCEDTLELATGGGWAHLQITRIHMPVAPISTIQWLLATLQNTGQMDHCQVFSRSIEAIPVLDPVYVEEAYSHIASRYDSIQQHVRSHGWRYASVGQGYHWVKGRLVLHCEVSSTEAVQIL